MNSNSSRFLRLISLAIAVLFAAPSDSLLAQGKGKGKGKAGQAQAKGQGGNKKSDEKKYKNQKKKILSGHEVDIGELVYDRFSDAEKQIRITRMILKHLRTSAHEAVAYAGDRETLKGLARVVEHLENSRSALADIHVQVAECMAESARADRASANGQAARMKQKRKEMKGRLRKAETSLNELQKSSDRLTKIYPELGDNESSKLSRRMDNEVEKLADLVFGMWHDIQRDGKAGEEADDEEDERSIKPEGKTAVGGTAGATEREKPGVVEETAGKVGTTLMDIIKARIEDLDRGGEKKGKDKKDG